MQVPLEITFRGIEKNEALEALIREKARKLEQVCGHMTSCRVAIDAPSRERRPRRGNPYGVRIDMRVPPGHELVVRREPGEGDGHDPIEVVIRNAFEAARRQLKQLAEKERRDVKRHPEEEAARAFVVRLFKEQGYGFIRAADGREFYFHRNSVLHGDFGRLEIGTGVRFAEEMGEKGPQASSVQIVDKPGVRAARAGVADLDKPPGVNG